MELFSLQVCRDYDVWDTIGIFDSMEASLKAREEWKQKHPYLTEYKIEKFILNKSEGCEDSYYI